MEGGIDMNRNRINSFMLICIISIIMLIPNYTYSAERAILGDINRDGKVDSMDLLYIMRHIISESSEEHKEWLLEGEKLQLADMTENGKVDSSDMLVVLRYIAANNNQEKIGKEHPEWLEQKEIELKSFSEIKEEQEESKIKTIKLNKSLIEMEKGTAEQVIASIEPKELSNEKIEWRIVNSRIAEIDKNGKITAKENGETIVIARTEDGKEAVSKVKVGTNVKEIVVDKEEVKIDLSERKTEKIEVKVEPEDASNKEIKIDNSNERVATIDGEGKITAKSNGEAELTLKASNGIEKKIKVAVTTSETGIKLDKNYVQLDLGNNKQGKLVATIEPSTASNKEVTYISSNEKIATVDKEGKITAKGNGETNIIARTTNGKEAVCKVEVKAVATTIEMDEEVKIDLSKGKEKKITVEVKPDNAETKAVMVRSSNEEIATIDANGKVTAKKNGTAIITAELVGTDIVENCKVLITTSPTGLKLSKTSANLDMSGTKTMTITAEIEPSTATNQEIEWSNNNSKIVYMSTSGKKATINALQSGTATITAKIKGANISKQCKITVTAAPTSVTLNKTSANIDMSGNKTIQLKATVKPDNLSNKKISWSSSNTKVATVDENGMVLARSNGKTQITAKTSNNKIAKCDVTVSTNPTSIVLDRNTLTIEGIREIKLNATVNPSKATNKTISWSSNNTKVATVDKNGKVAGKSKGTATITAKTSNGKTDTCKVTVKDGYWEIKNNRYIYHYLDGTSKELSKSCYISHKKIKDVKSYDPNPPKAVKGLSGWTNVPFTYAKIYHKNYYCYDNTANNLAIKNSGSKYAIVVDESIAVVHIYRQEKNEWIPDRTFTANHLRADNHLLGVHYINGNRHPGTYTPAGWYDHFWVAFGADKHNDYNEDYFHHSPAAPKGDAKGVTGEVKGILSNKGCVMLSYERAKWIYYNCGRGTPVLIW